MRISGKLIWIGVMSVALFIGAFMTVGVNYNGYRTVVQWPNGTTFVKFSPGIYWQFFGHSEVYPDVITYSFIREEQPGERTLSQKGIIVRYQDGGTGTIFGNARFDLPRDEPTMLALHKAFRTSDGVAWKLIKPLTEEAENSTAGLMSSEEAYAEKRGVFGEWSRDQIQRGKYKTRLQAVETKEEGTERTIVKNVPIIAIGTDGQPLHLDSDLRTYGISVSGYQVVDWDFEPKTLEQIATKRQATMGIITAKANADRAKQDAITAEQEGLKNVTVAKYEKEVEKERAVVEAQRDKEVAVIAAQKLVDVAEKGKLEAEQKKLAAAEYKQEQILRGDGDAAYKKAVIEADGALQQKLATYEKVNARYAEAMSKQKWVPEVQMGKGEGNVNEASTLIDLLTAKTAKDLGLDLSVPKGMQNQAPSK